MTETTAKTRSAHSASVDSIILDSEHALTHAGGDVGLLLQMCTAFLGELPYRMEQLGEAMHSRDHHIATNSLQSLRNCLLVFGSGQLSFTAEMLESALRGRRQRQAQREWTRLQRQVSTLVPQVQCLLLELSQPSGAVQ